MFGFVVTSMARAEIPLHRIDTDAQTILMRLHQKHHEAYLVGGCVRDLLLHKTPKDFDIATSATPTQIKALFRNCRIVGRRFQLAHIIFGKKIIEVATFRAQPEPEPEENPEEERGNDLLIRHDNVFGTVLEDAQRRDFTINGLFYDIQQGHVIDHINGLDDLQKKQIRTIGDPYIRFQEDPVRMLRAVRFAAWLGFDIEDNTYQALCEHAGEVVKSAPPRLLEEIYRLFRRGTSVETTVLLQETGLLAHLLPRLFQTLQQDPVWLDPYLRVLDNWVKQGIAIDTTTLLYVLAAPDLVPFFQPDVSLCRADALLRHINHALSALSAQIPVFKKDAEMLRSLLITPFYPRKRRRAQPRKPEPVLSKQIEELWKAVLGGMPFQHAPLVESVKKTRSKRRNARRGRRKAKPLASTAKALS